MLKGYKIPNPLSINRIYSFFRKKFDSGYFFKGESHDFYEVVCVISGQVGITAGKQVLTLSKGDMIYHPPGEFHAIWDENESCPETIIFSFSATAFPYVSGKCFQIGEDGISEIIGIYNKISSLLPKISEESYSSDEIDLAIEIKRLEMFMISRLCVDKGYSGTANAHSTAVFSSILSVMEKNTGQALNVTKIAELCGISVPTLEKTVYRYLGYGAMAHYNTLRMQKAHTMLISGASVKETSLSLGFSNQNYFSARFKKYYGYAPSKVLGKHLDKQT